MNTERLTDRSVIVIGGGFTGLTAAYELTRRGIQVTLLEADEDVGGLAGSFMVGETKLECFYHHCFVNDSYVMELTEDLGLQDYMVKSPTSTGMYFSKKFYRLSTPFDLLRFKPLSFVNRFKLGLLVLKARKYKDWEKLDDITAAEWITSLAGKEVFRVAWEPLLVGKFGDYASQISAAWFWGKLVLRGGSRGKMGEERLVYFHGGFARIIDSMVQFIVSHGGEILYNTRATGLDVQNGRITGVFASGERLTCKAVLATTALPIVADLLKTHVPGDFIQNLCKVNYLANVCLVLQLDQKLSDLYWINVNDHSFPFVGIIEHTNLEPPAFYSGYHIVYLSKYLTPDKEMYCLSDDELLSFALPHIQRIFPKFHKTQIKNYKVWRARYAQPLVTCGYRNRIPENTTPINGFYIASMAQIYPEDRGINFAIRDGQRIAQTIQHYLKGQDAIKTV